jgi:UDP-N-acetylglucosamine 2-epimerase (non-hydrolysing)
VSAANTIGNLITAIDNVFEQVKPEAMLVLGDTNSCLSVIPAKRRKVPIFHMEAGNRCFDQRVPEETNRRIVDHVSDINLTYSTIAREYLLREGLPPDQVIKTGSPMFEVLQHYMPQIKASKALERMELSVEKYFLVSAHREENIESEGKFVKLVMVLNELAEEHQLPVIVSTHPRTKKRVEASQVKFHPNVILMKPLGFHDYVSLQMQSKAVLSDSGTINEESSILNFPALNLRESHERPEGMEETSVMMVGLELSRVRQGLSILENQKRGKNRGLQLVADYSVPNVSEKIVRIIHSYTDYVNRVVWQQD